MIISLIKPGSPRLENIEELTQGCTVIMDTDAFLSLGQKPLKDRENIVVTKDRNYHALGITVMTTLDEALRFAALEQGRHFEEKQEETEVFILGKELTAEAATRAQKVY